MEKIKTLIEQKIKEHEHEIKMSMNLMDKYRIDMSNIQVKVSNRDEDLLKDTVKLGVLKDKILFHRAAVAVLQDLKETVDFTKD
jgi:hypothetical protein